MLLSLASESLHPLQCSNPANRFTALSLTSSLPPILHFSAQEPYTKYDMCALLARLDAKSLEMAAVEEGPKKGETVRPRDCHLANVRSSCLRGEAEN